MKTHKLSIGILFISLLTTGSLLAQNDVKEQLVVPLSDPGKPGTLRASLINGSIHVVGYTGKDVVIDIVSTANSRQGKRNESDEKASNGMKRINAGNPLDVSAREKNNTVNVEVNSIQQSVDLTIKVPQQFSLRIGTINHGEITVENVNGELEVNNVNGAIELNNISGSAVANTVNGAVKATFKSVSADAPMAFSTLNGNVDVTFPASAKMNVKLKSDRGDVFTDFDIDVDKGPSRVSRTNQNGMYRVSIDEWVQGKVNGGGREIMMKNMNGNIYVRKAK
ncbi:DUF4097 family beta strand repeat-containing protein [Spirosoma validum]|uniref:DUF4097 family beta strand repeat protein n=1 Tax=Spirosoma validum TaxID=2771355 RepID=A0A927GBD8_9BACT|nr:DUF4097 family beta strand repeat-containing protein [Spirosoma validum]MBD2751597.1 DUF4097 family beta strand repeat protein [Spirosoma validum]